MFESAIKSRWIRPLIGLSITLSFLWLFFRGLAIDKIMVAFTKISIQTLLLSLAFLTAGYTLRIIRWWLMMRGLVSNLLPQNCAWPFLVSVAANNVLPLRAGDVLRVFGFQKTLRVPTTEIIGTLLIERLLDLSTLLIFFFVGLMGVPAGKFPSFFVNSAIGVATLGAAIVLILLLLSEKLKSWFGFIIHLRFFRNRGFTRPLIKHVDHLFHVLDILGTKNLRLHLIVLSILIWSFEGGVFVSVAYGLGLESIFPGSYFSLATGTLATLLPSSPGYFGTFDYFSSYGMEVFGTQREIASIFALMVHFVLWLPLTLVGMAYYLRPSIMNEIKNTQKTNSRKILDKP